MSHKRITIIECFSTSLQHSTAPWPDRSMQQPFDQQASDQVSLRICLQVDLTLEQPCPDCHGVVMQSLSTMQKQKLPFATCCSGRFAGCASGRSAKCLVVETTKNHCGATPVRQSRPGCNGQTGCSTYNLLCNCKFLCANKSPEDMPEMHSIVVCVGNQVAEHLMI